MNGPSPVSPSETPDQSSATPLDSWKEIASYVKRDISTAQRWEKREGMPVHRHVHDKRGSVYAFGSELGVWLQSRKLRLEEQEEEHRSDMSEETGGDHRPSGTPWARLWFGISGIAILTLLIVAYLTTRSRAVGATQSKIESLAVLP